MDQFFKIFEVIMSFTTAKSQTLSKQVLISVKKMISYIIVSIGAMTLFCVGVSMALTNLAEQLDKPILVGSVLALMSIGVLIYSFKQKPWVTTSSNETGEERRSETSPIEEAVALLIKDIIEERHAKRVTTQTNENQNL